MPGNEDRERYYAIQEAIASQSRKTIDPKISSAALKASIITPRFRRSTWETYRQDAMNRAAIERAREITDVAGLGVWLWGDPGVGKTHLVSAVGNAWIDKGVPVAFVGIMHLMAQIQDGFARNDSSQGLIQRLASMPVLILDDIEKITLTRWSASMMLRLIDARFQQDRSLIVTSNLAPEAIYAAQKRACVAIPDLDRNVMQAISDRLHELTQVVIRVAGKSAR